MYSETETASVGCEAVIRPGDSPPGRTVFGHVKLALRVAYLAPKSTERPARDLV
jgi:hypothetical protein